MRATRRTRWSVNHIASVQSNATTHSWFMSVSQERRCKRGGGYRMRAKSYRPRFWRIVRVRLNGLDSENPDKEK